MTHVKTVSDLNKDSFKALQEKLGLKNAMQAPHLSKIVISNGFGFYYLTT